MLYRNLGKTNEKISILGLDCKNATEESIDYAIDNGINFFDVTNAERFPDNDDVFLSVSSKRNESNLKGFLDEKLKILERDSIDFFNLTLTGEDFEKQNPREFLDECLSTGKVKHLGFRAFMEMDYLVEILDDYPKFEVVTTQMSYVDTHYRCGEQGLNHLKNFNIGSIVENPLRSNCLVDDIPDNVKELFDYADIKRTPLEWALGYLWNRDDVDCVICDGKNLESKVNCICDVDSFSANDCEILRTAAIELWQNRSNRCDICNHCLPCPEGVNIPYCFREYNMAKIFNNPQSSKNHYYNLLDEKERASNCIMCMECNHICPQMINIAEELENVREFFE